MLKWHSIQSVKHCSIQMKLKLFQISQNQKGGSSGDKSASWWHPWGHPGSEHDRFPSGSILYKETNKQATNNKKNFFYRINKAIQKILEDILALSMARQIPIQCNLDRYFTKRQTNKRQTTKKCKLINYLASQPWVCHTESWPKWSGSTLCKQANKQTTRKQINNKWKTTDELLWL